LTQRYGESITIKLSWMWQVTGEAMGRVEGKSPKGFVDRWVRQRERLRLSQEAVNFYDKVVRVPPAGIHLEISRARIRHFIAT